MGKSKRGPKQWSISGALHFCENDENRGTGGSKMAKIDQIDPKPKKPNFDSPEQVKRLGLNVKRWRYRAQEMLMTQKKN